MVIDSDSSKFKLFFIDFLKKLNENDINTFGKFSCDESKLNFVFSIPFVHSYKIQLEKNLKSPELARQLKEGGNCAFQVEQYKHAIELYSKSIIKQPQNSSSKITLCI